MSLSKKIVIVILLICILFSILFFFVLRITVYGGIGEQKSSFAQRIIIGALSVLEKETERIYTFTEDWGAWDSMYSYVTKQTPILEQNLAIPLAIKDGHFSIFLALNKEKDLIKVEGYDLLKNQPLSFDLLKQKKGDIWRFLNQTFNLEESASGIVNSQHGPIIIVSSPILHSDNSGPFNGRILMGRLIDHTIEKFISKVIGEKASLLKSPKGMKCINENEKIPQILDQKNVLCISYPVTDVWDQQLFTLQVDARKHAFKTLENAILLFFSILILGILLLGVLLYLIMNHLVVHRVKQISIITNKVLSLDDLSQRIHLTQFYRDEITQLSNNINEMLKRLQMENITKEEVERMAMLNEKLIFLGRVSADITHEINNPLFAIENSIRYIKKNLSQNPGNNRVNEVLQVVEQEIKRVKSIAHNIHKYAMPRMNRSKLSDITTVMDTAIKVISWSKSTEHFIIDYKKKSHSFPLYCNPETLQQVFMNIILNSIEAMNGKGRLDIDVSESMAIYKIDFIDNGPGCSDNIKAELFNPFKSTKTGQGAGLGLNISYNIIKNHGGSITFDENYHGGARFIIRIPKGGSRKDAKIKTIVHR
jgi:signal transduction histidine kinase